MTERESLIQPTALVSGSADTSPSRDSLVSFWRETVLPVGTAMERQLATDIGLLQQVTRLLLDRLAFGVPSLVMMAVAAEYRCQDPALVDIAAIIETIQSSVLAIHGSVDRSTLPPEGGLPTSAVVLVGDYLTTRAFQAMVRVGRLDVIEILSEAIGSTVELATAQRFGTGQAGVSSHPDASMTAYSTLTGTSAGIGAAVAGAPVEQQSIWRQYGKYLGSAVRLLGIRVPLGGSAASHGAMIEHRYGAPAPTTADLELAWHHCAEAARLAGEVKSIANADFPARICQLCEYSIRTRMLQ